MLFPVKLYLRDKWIVFPFIVSGLFIVLIFWFVLSKIKPATEDLFLHYNIIFGVDLVGAWWKLYLIPAAALFGGGTNLMVSYFLYRNNALVARFIAAATAALELFLLIAANLIIGLN